MNFSGGRASTPAAAPPGGRAAKPFIRGGGGGHGRRSRGPLRAGGPALAQVVRRGTARSQQKARRRAPPRFGPQAVPRPASPPRPRLGGRRSALTRPRMGLDAATERAARRLRRERTRKSRPEGPAPGSAHCLAQAARPARVWGEPVPAVPPRPARRTPHSSGHPVRSSLSGLVRTLGFAPDESASPAPPRPGRVVVPARRGNSRRRRRHRVGGVRIVGRRRRGGTMIRECPWIRRA